MNSGKILLVSFLSYIISGVIIGILLPILDIYENWMWSLIIGVGAGFFEWVILFFGYLRPKMNYILPGITVWVYFILSLVVFLPAFIISAIVVNVES